MNNEPVYFSEHSFLTIAFFRSPGDMSLEVSESVEVAMVDTEEVVITMTEPAEDPRTVGPGI